MRLPRTSDLIFFNSGALPNILHYITLHYITDGRGATFNAPPPGRAHNDYKSRILSLCRQHHTTTTTTTTTKNNILKQD